MPHCAPEIAQVTRLPQITCGCCDELRTEHLTMKLDLRTRPYRDIVLRGKALVRSHLHTYIYIYLDNRSPLKMSVCKTTFLLNISTMS